MSDLIRSSSTGHLLYNSGNGHLLNSVSAGVTIATTALVHAIHGVAYSQTMTAIGGTAPYTWSLVSGSFPSGISMNSSGVISGSSTVGDNTFSVQIMVTDSASHTDTVTFSLVLGTISFVLSGNAFNNYEQIKLSVTDPASTTTTQFASWPGGYGSYPFSTTITPAQMYGAYTFHGQIYDDPHGVAPFAVTCTAYFGSTPVQVNNASGLYYPDSTPTYSYTF